MRERTPRVPIVSSTVTVGRTSSGTSEQAPLDSDCGSIGSTEPGT